MTSNELLNVGEIYTESSVHIRTVVCKNIGLPILKRFHKFLARKSGAEDTKWKSGWKTILS